MKLADVLPEFATDLSKGLSELGHQELAGTVTDIEIVERCGCSESGCLTFYAVPKSQAACWPQCERVICPAPGVTCIHYQSGRIIWVEALGRPLDREKLDGFHSTNPTL